MIRSARLARLEQACGKGGRATPSETRLAARSFEEKIAALSAKLAASGHALPADEAYNRRMRDELALTLSKLRGGCDA